MKSLTIFFLSQILLFGGTGTVDASATSFDTCKRDEQCINGGLCEFLDGDGQGFRHCHCPNGFGGMRCEKHCPLRCQNGGVCLDFRKDALAYLKGETHDNDYSCKCLGYYTGKLCNIPYQNCGNGKRCLYGGTCPEGIEIDTRGDNEYCHCPEGRSGQSCEIDIQNGPDLSMNGLVDGLVSFNGSNKWRGFSLDELIAMGVVALVLLSCLAFSLRSRYRGYNTVTKQHDDKCHPRLKSRQQTGKRGINLATALAEEDITVHRGKQNKGHRSQIV